MKHLLRWKFGYINAFSPTSNFEREIDEIDDVFGKHGVLSMRKMKVHLLISKTVLIIYLRCHEISSITSFIMFYRPINLTPKVSAQICRVPLSWNNDVVFLTALRVGHKHSTSSAAQLKSKSFQHACFGFRNANSKGTWDAPASTQWQINFWLQKLTEKIFETMGKPLAKQSLVKALQTCITETPLSRPTSAQYMRYITMVEAMVEDWCRTICCERRWIPVTQVLVPEVSANL